MSAEMMTENVEIDDELVGEDVADDAKFRTWVFTVNNWTDDDVTKVMAMSEVAKYMIVAKEVGASGTPHLHGPPPWPGAQDGCSCEPYSVELV